MPSISKECGMRVFDDESTTQKNQQYFYVKVYFINIRINSLLLLAYQMEMLLKKVI